MSALKQGARASQSASLKPAVSRITVSGLPQVRFCGANAKDDGFMNNILDNNKKWVQEMTADNTKFFEKFKEGQTVIYIAPS
jgi:hypothetical protein